MCSTCCRPTSEHSTAPQWAWAAPRHAWTRSLRCLSLRAEPPCAGRAWALPDACPLARATADRAAPPCPPLPVQLRGPFAFLLYDRPHGRVVAGRSADGAEPLAWGATMLSEGLLFASSRHMIDAECAGAEDFPAGALFVSEPFNTAGQLLRCGRLSRQHTWRAVCCPPAAFVPTPHPTGALPVVQAGGRRGGQGQACSCARAAVARQQQRAVWHANRERRGGQVTAAPMSCTPLQRSADRPTHPS